MEGAAPGCGTLSRFSEYFSGSAGILALKRRMSVIVASGARSVARHRPGLVSPEGEADQGHEDVDVRVALEAGRHPVRAGHEPDGGGSRQVFLDTPNAPRREVQVDVVVGVEVGDLAVG